MQNGMFSIIFDFILFGEFTFKQEYIFRLGKRCKIIKYPSKYAFKCSKMEAVVILDIKIFQEGMPPDPSRMTVHKH